MTDLNITKKLHQIAPSEHLEVDFEKNQDLMSKNYLTRDENIIKLFDIVYKILPTTVPILIKGEDGVGKEQFSKAIHISADKSRGRFIEANCTNLPANFFEMELFGTQKTYYSETQPAMSQYFDVCTLMLDEVTNLDKHLQFTLLRILREQENSNKRQYTGTALDARIIACTSKNIPEEINAGRFNAELYTRLNLIHLEIPALRDRVVDIDLYSELFLKEFNTHYGKSIKLTSAAKQSLRQYTWPGNIRELKNLIHRAALLQNSEIDCKDLTWVNLNSVTEIAMSSPLPQITLHQLEQRLILQTLRRYHGNRTHAAKALGISLRTLRYKLKELAQYGYEIDMPRNF